MGDDDSVSKAIEFVNAREKPLALYIFSESSSTVDAVIAKTSSGGACVNDVAMHVVRPHMTCPCLDMCNPTVLFYQGESQVTLWWCWPIWSWRLSWTTWFRFFLTQKGNLFVRFSSKFIP